MISAFIAFALYVALHFAVKRAVETHDGYSYGHNQYDAYDGRI